MLFYLLNAVPQTVDECEDMVFLREELHRDADYVLPRHIPGSPLFSISCDQSSQACDTHQPTVSANQEDAPMFEWLEIQETIHDMQLCRPPGCQLISRIRLKREDG